MKKGILLAVVAVLGATGCESFKKGCKTCGYGSTTPANGAAVAKTTTTTSPGNMMVNTPAGGKVALPDYSGKTIQLPAGASATLPNYSQQLGSKLDANTIK